MNVSASLAHAQMCTRVVLTLWLTAWLRYFVPDALPLEIGRGLCGAEAPSTGNRSQLEAAIAPLLVFGPDSSLKSIHNPTRET